MSTPASPQTPKAPTELGTTEIQIPKDADAATKKDFQAMINNDKELNVLLKKVASGTATIDDRKEEAKLFEQQSALSNKIDGEYVDKLKADLAKGQGELDHYHGESNWEKVKEAWGGKKAEEMQQTGENIQQDKTTVETLRANDARRREVLHEEGEYVVATKPANYPHQEATLPTSSQSVPNNKPVAPKGVQQGQG